MVTDSRDLISKPYGCRGHGATFGDVRMRKLSARSSHAHVALLLHYCILEKVCCLEVGRSQDSDADGKTVCDERYTQISSCAPLRRIYQRMEFRPRVLRVYSGVGGRTVRATVGQSAWSRRSIGLLVIPRDVLSARSNR